MIKSKLQQLISISSTVKIDDNIFFHETYGNRIFRYSLKDEVLVCLARSPFSTGHRLGYMGVSQYKDKIYFFPYYAKEICIYDIRTNTIENKRCNYQYITKAINYGEKFFFWADEQNSIICFDVENDIQEEIKLPNEMRINARCGGGIEVNGKLYIPAKEKGMIFCVDTQILSVQPLTVTDEKMMFETIAFDGEDLWLSGTRKKIIKWNLKKRIKEEYSLEYLEDRKIEMPWDSYFHSSIVFGEYVYFSPFKAKQLIRIHIRSSKVEKILEMYENEGTMLIDDWNKYLYFSCKNLKDGMALMDCLIDENGCVCKEKILFGETDCNIEIQEHNEYSLKNFISQIKGEHNEEIYFK